MKVFAHINELGGDGWASLRSLVLACPKVVIWGPSAHELRRVRTYRKTVPDPAELLWYIREGHIQVLARKWWLTDPAKRAKNARQHWKGNTWIEEFDSPILEMFGEDQESKRDLLSARVRAANDQTGPAWAVEQIREHRINCTLLIKKLQQKNLNPKAFPKGYLEKIKVLPPEQATHSLLKDARNHSLAFVESQADRNFGSPTDEQLREVFAESIQVPERDSQVSQETSPSVDKLAGAVDFVLQKISRSGTPPHTQDEAFHRTQLILEDKQELASLRSWCDVADRLSTSSLQQDIERSLISDLHSQMVGGTVYAKFIDYFKPKSIEDWGRILLESLFAFHEHAAPVSVTFEASVGVLRWLGWWREEFNGPRWPLLLAHGSSSSYRRRRERFMRTLKPS
jgi:hypothetical protein